jgi:TDG/mug DNA glycosylase family protein
MSIGKHFPRGYRQEYDRRLPQGTGEGLMSSGVPERVAAERWTMSRDECRQGVGKAVPDLVSDNLRVLFVGINPSTCSGARGLHFASPGNRFWPTLHLAGFTPRQFRPDERDELLALGVGISNLVNRATSRADEVDADELRAGADRLRQLVASVRPRFVAVLGKRAYETAFAVGKVAFGRQAMGVADVPLWILPNPSGLNAYYTVERLAERYSRLREAIA